MKALYQISKSRGDEHHFVHAYAWADSEEEALTLSKSGNKFDMHAELWISKKFDANIGPFCTVPTSGTAWLGPGTDRPLPQPLV